MLKQISLPFLLLATLTVTAQTKKPTTAVKPKPAATTPAAAAQPLKTPADSLSYAFGISLGEYLKNQGISSINFALLNKAIDQSLKAQKTFLTAEQANACIGGAVQAKAEKATSAEKEKGRRFLEANAKKAGIKQTPSGLQYEVLVDGKGPRPTITDTILAHYKGILIDGKVDFDNSYTRGEPLQIPVAGVIPGWTEALQLMNTGSKWRLYIPSSLGYGDYGAGGEIPGGATLIFEVELLEIVGKK